MAHKDTMGNEIIIGADEVQRTSAGTGLYHSEWNHADDPVHFFQIWLSPDKGQKVFLYIINGTLSSNGFTLNKGDQGRIAAEKILEIAAMEEVDFLLIDAPSQ